MATQGPRAQVLRPQPLTTLAALAAALVLGGCQGSVRTTTTPRSATEVLLVSSAGERAVSRFDASALAGRRVHLDWAYFASVDAPYVHSALRQHLARVGAVLVGADADPAPDVVLEARSGSLGTWTGSFLVGIPPLPLPLSPGGGAGDVVTLTPSLTVGLETRQGWGRFQVYGYDPATGEVVFPSQTVWGAASGRTPYDLFDDIYPPFFWDGYGGSEAADEAQ